MAALLGGYGIPPPPGTYVQPNVPPQQIPSYMTEEKLQEKGTLSCLLASFFKGQDHQGIFSLVKGNIRGNLKFLL